MKKRLFVAAIALVMLLSCILSSCSTVSDEEVGDADLVDTTGYACIKVYGVKNPGTTDEAIAAVEEAINVLTLKEFKTKVKLMLYTDDEYDKAIEDAKEGLKQLEAQKKKEKADSRAESKRLAKLKTNDYEAYKKEMDAIQKEKKRIAAEKAAREAQLQKEAEAAGVEYIPEIDVPDVAIDVILARDSEELKKFKEDSMLKPLSEYVSLDYKSIAKFIHPTLLGMGKINDTIYGIVNNTFAGTVQYAVFDTELYEKYSSVLTDVKNLGSFRAYFEAIKENEADVLPLLNIPEFIPDGDYLTNSANPIGVYNPDNAVEEEFHIVNLFSNTNYQAYFNNILTFRKEGYLPADDNAVNDQTKWAVKFVSGDEYTKRALEAEGYTVKEFTSPKITDENCNVSFYGVYADTAYPTRAMQFIEMLTTDENLQMIFAYGIEGVNYELTEDGRVKRLNDTYSIDLSYVGNRFIGHPTVDEDPNLFDIAREMNKNVKISALYGTKFDYSKDYIEEYSVEKVGDNVKGGADAALESLPKISEDSEDRFKFSDLVNGEYAPDAHTDEYQKQLTSYCLSYAVGGGYFITSAYNEEKDGFYVVNTERSKLNLPTEFNALIHAKQLPSEIVELMKTASASSDKKEQSLLVQDPNNENNSTYYSVYPIIESDKVVGLVCSISYLEDTIVKLEGILAEYWDDITTGIPDSSIARFADKISNKIAELENERSILKRKYNNASTPDEKLIYKLELDEVPSNQSAIRELIAEISTDTKVVDGYVNALYKKYTAYASGKLSHDAYASSVKSILKKDYIKIWNVWDEISDMNKRFEDETNMISLLELLNKQYK